MDLKKERWVAIDGSVFSEKEVEVKQDFQWIKRRESVAFNVGPEMADYIVGIHNSNLLVNEWVDKHVKLDAD